MNTEPILILASGSPRRQQLLRDAGFSFVVKPSHAEEDFPEDMPAHAVPLYLAEKKAMAFAEELMSSDEIIITADTVVILSGRVMNKPADKPEAVRMLAALSGHTHEVVTGVCLRSLQNMLSFSELSMVTFRELNIKEIEYYIDNYSPFDKAGAYGAQDWMGMIGVERIEGSYYNVMGLPIHRVYTELNNMIAQLKAGFAK
ncbi:MAG: Maf family nucleotide pyrophosphatase [Bacteroidota bacterium]